MDTRLYTKTANIYRSVNARLNGFWDGSRVGDDDIACPRFVCVARFAL